MIRIVNLLFCYWELNWIWVIENNWTVVSWQAGKQIEMIICSLITVCTNIVFWLWKQFFIKLKSIVVFYTDSLRMWAEIAGVVNSKTIRKFKMCLRQQQSKTTKREMKRKSIKFSVIKIIDEFLIWVFHWFHQTDCEKKIIYNYLRTKNYNWMVI